MRSCSYYQGRQNDQLSTQLTARMIDQGSMAYLLSTPTTRRRIAMTQASVLAAGLLLIMVITTAAGFIGDACFIGGRFEFNVYRFMQLNSVAWLLFIAVGGISFFVSTFCNDEKKVQGISSFLIFGMFGVDMLGKIAGSMEWLRYVSIFSLYRPGEIASGGGIRSGLGYSAVDWACRIHNRNYHILQTGFATLVMYVFDRNKIVEVIGVWYSQKRDQVRQRIMILDPRFVKNKTGG